MITPMLRPRRKPTHKERILDLLSDGQWHDTVELHAICWRYGARLWDLRQAGYLLEKRQTADAHIEEWRLVGAPAETAARMAATSPPPAPASVSSEPHQRRLL
jgi:hypothetical protein